MSKIKQGKLRLLQGASAILVLSGGIAGAQAQTADPTQVGSTITNTGTDGVIASDQSTTSDVTATAGSATAADGTDNVTTVGAVTDGSVAGGGTTGSVALGNLDTLTFTDSGSAINSTSDAMVALQASTGATGDANNILIKADTLNTTTGLTAGAVTSSTLSVNGSSDTSSATANSATQTMTLNATELTLGTASATANSVLATGALDLDASGKAVAASLQTNSFADVEANTTGSTIELTGGVITDSALSVSSNVQSATAAGSTATNGITVSGTSLGIGVAIASQQLNDADSTVGATTEGSATLSVTSLDGSSATMSGNRLQSQATGGQTTNTLVATGTNVTLAAADDADAATVSGGAGTVSGAFVTLNDQEVNGSVSASTTTETATSAMKIGIGGDAVNSSLTNDSNLVSAKAQGALTTNQTTLTVAATLDRTSGGTDVANGATVANVQTVGSTADITASVTTDLGAKDMILTDVDGNLTSSTLSNSSNRITAIAEGANATNGLVVSATDISVAGTTSGVPTVESAVDGVQTANAAFSVLNSQVSGTGEVSATTGDDATVMTIVGGTIDNSSISSNANVIGGFATSNKAANTLTLAGTTVAGDAGLLSAQTSSSDVLTTIGDTAQAGVFVQSDGDITDSAISVANNVVQGSAVNNSVNNQMTVTATTLDGDGTSAKAVASGSPTTVIEGTGTDPDTTEIASSKAQADYSLANLQTVDSSASTVTDIDATFGIDQLSGQLMQDSKLSVSNNTQFGEALANTATNKMTLNATDAGAGIVPTAALSSTQEAIFTKEATNGAATNDVSSTSDMNVYVSAASTGSSIAANGNANTALAVMNNAGNTLSVTGTNLAGTAVAPAAPAAATIDAGVSATADVALNSYQTAQGNLASSASTNLYNFDEAQTAAAGTLNGSVSFANNATMAEASANRVANALTVSGTAEVGSTAALNNTQISNTVVDATASSAIEYTMQVGTSLFDADATNVYAAESSSIVVDGNTTTAMARGNTANNTLNYAVGASYAGAVATPVVNSGGTDLSAGAALMNNQSNSGAVTASATTVTYALNLDGNAANAGTDPVVNFDGALNSNVNLTNNSTAAAAYGNSAVNTLAMGTFGSGIPSSGLSSLQSNSGAVVAQATSVGYNLTITGGSSGTAVRNTGNVVTAQAVGNSSISTITGGN